ncbi:MAG: hypothetical protein AABN95_10755 [Acidobacteriota bacterium]
MLSWIVSFLSEGLESKASLWSAPARRRFGRIAYPHKLVEAHALSHLRWAKAAPKTDGRLFGVRRPGGALVVLPIPTSLSKPTPFVTYDGPKRRRAAALQRWYPRA